VGAAVGERRLGAIMFTDVVGYSAISSLNEGRALKLLEEHRGLLGSVFAKFNGRVVKTMGDGFLVEFASAVEAVNCAVEAQTELAKFNGGRGEGEKVFVRIGIHVGDIVHSGGDVLGDAVNVAARVQPIAEAGGICLTRQVVDQVERKVGYRMVRIGTRELKNIRYPVELYKVEVPQGVSRAEEAVMDQRRVAILPFVNLSPDPNDRYFADGLTEELISTVSRIGELSVISRTSVMRYKDTTVPIGEIGRELGAGTILEGSVRKAGNKVRVTTQLIDAQNDRHLWAQSYDRDLTDVFVIQADIAEKVAEALRVKLLSKEKQALEKKAVKPKAYTLYLKGRFFWNERTKEGVEKAAKYFEDAIKLDPEFSQAYSGLADCYMIREDRAWLSHAEARVANKYAEKAVELDPESAEAHASLGLALHKDWDFAGAGREFKLAIELSPNYANAYHWYWVLLGQEGRHEEALTIEKRAHTLDPYSSIIGQGLGVEYLYLGRYKEALAQFEVVEEIDPAFASVHFWKAWAYDQLGESETALEEAKKAVEGSSAGGVAPKMVLGWLYAKVGQKDQAARMLGEILAESGGYVAPSVVAVIKLGLGEKDDAFELLNRAYREHDGFLMYFSEFPWFAEYRADPRWPEIEKKLGIPRA
jgi:adenylate cyclase